jgi:hypothetical protein
MKHAIIFALALCCHAQTWADRNADVIAMRMHIGNGEATVPIEATRQPNGIMIHVRPHAATERLLVVAFYVEAGEPRFAYRWTPVRADLPYTVVLMGLSAGARLTSVTVEGYAGARGVWWSEYVVDGEEGQEW